MINRKHNLGDRQSFMQYGMYNYGNQHVKPMDGLAC